MVKRLLDALVLGLVLTLLAGGSLAQNSVAPSTPPLSAFVDRTDIAINDVITLTIRTDASLGNTRPSLDGLNRDFEQVGGTSTRSTYTNNNGAIQSWNEFSISLRPRAAGTLTIPAIRVGTAVTNPITIRVGEASTDPVDSSDEIFMESSVSKSEIYVQEQLVYTIKIYYSIGFDQGAQLTSPQVGDAVVQQLGSDDNYQEVVNGIGYNVTERRFVIYPQSSGELSIPPVYFTASVGRRSGINRFFNNRSQMREINLASDAHEVAVLPRPASFPANATWLPAAELKLEESWSGPLENVPVGEAVTRNIVMTATGLSSSLLPGITYEPQPGLKFYGDQPVREDLANRDGVVGKRSEGTAIVASDPGNYQLPEVRVPWWNTTTNQLETATLPARTLVIPEPEGGEFVEPDTDFVPIAGTDAPAAPVQAATGSASGMNLLWIGTTVGFACLWLFSTMMWLRSRREGAEAALVLPQGHAPQATNGKQKAVAVTAPDADVCLRVLHTACANANLHDVRAALLKWGQASFGSGPMSLDQLAQRIGDTTFSAQVRALDGALYGNAPGSFDSKALYEHVAALHKRGVNRHDSDRFALPPLYKAQ
ncbi:MAG TPA: BatD family protein [Pseudomonadales bacterium]